MDVEGNGVIESENFVALFSDPFYRTKETVILISLIIQFIFQVIFKLK